MPALTNLLPAELGGLGGAGRGHGDVMRLRAPVGPRHKVVGPAVYDLWRWRSYRMDHARYCCERIGLGVTRSIEGQTQHRIALADRVERQADLERQNIPGRKVRQ